MTFPLSARLRNLSIPALLLCAAAASSAGAQTISTIAGGAIGDGNTPSAASLDFPGALAVDAAGNLYIADGGHNRVRKVTKAGVVSTVVGAGYSGSTGDGGQAALATLDSPYGLAFDGSGNLFISEARGNRIRKVTPAGVISTVAGDGTPGVLNAPQNLAVASDGTIYVSESGSHRVRKIVNGSVLPFAGTGTGAYGGDGGPATGAALQWPEGLLAQEDGSVLIADSFNNRIRRVDTGGMISTFMTFDDPEDLARDANGVLHVMNFYEVVTVSDAGSVTGTVAGNDNANIGFAGDQGLATNAVFNNARAIAIAGDGRLFISDLLNERIRAVSGGLILTWIGPGATGDGGAASDAVISHPAGVAYDAAGTMYVSERYRHRIRAVTAAGNISTVAGTGYAGFQGGGGTSAVNAWLNQPRGIAVNAAGNVLFSDYSNNCVRIIYGNGQITNYAGRCNEFGNPLGDGGIANLATVSQPDQLAFNPGTGDVYIGQSGRLRKVAANGVISTAAGGGSVFADGVLATTVKVGRPGQIGFDSAGNVYFTDTTYHTVRKIDTNGIISTVVGTHATPGTSGDGAAASAALLLSPHALVVDANGDLTIGDASGRVRKVTGGIINSIAGTGVRGFNGDGAATATLLSTVTAFAKDATGNLVFVDSNRARRLSTGALPTPSLSIADVTIGEGDSGTRSATFTVSLSGASSAPVSFNLATADWNATAGSDYVARSQNAVTIPAGQTSTTFDVTVNGDTTVEPDEQFVVDASNVEGATVADGRGFATIVNDDTSASLSIADLSIGEGDSGTRTATFAVSLSQPVGFPVSFDIATADWNGLAGSDYVARSLQGVTIAAGQTTATFDVTINGDSTIEPDEQFVVDISNASGASVSDSRAFATILNDDSDLPVLTVHDAAISEGNAGPKILTFIVELSKTVAYPITLSYHTTAGGSALPGTDFIGVASASVQVPAGALAANFDIWVHGDAIAEPNEYFYVSLDQAPNAIIGNPLQPVGRVVSGWIHNDDAAAISAARIDAAGLYDDVDDGQREPVLSQKDYALLLLDVATQVCARADAATVVGVDRVENLAVLRELADTANRLCPSKPRYQAVMGKAKGEATGYLVEATDAKDVLGVDVLGKPRLDATARLSRVTVQGSGHAGPTTVLLPQGLSTRPVERAAQLKALGQRVQAELKSNPNARLVLIGEVTVRGLVDLTARSLPKQAALPNERVLVSPALLREFDAARVAFPKLPVNQKPAQVLQLQR